MNPVPVLNSRLYDGLKYVAQIVLPALGTLYAGLDSIWGLPNVNKVVTSIVVIDAFLGALLHLSSKAYNASDARFDGAINVSETPEKKTYSIELDSDPDELDKKDEVALKVQKDPVETPVAVKKATKKPAKKATKRVAKANSDVS